MANQFFCSCMEAGTIYCRKCEWQCKQWCEAANNGALCSIVEIDQAIQSEPVGKIVGIRMMQRMGEVRQQLKHQVEQLQLDVWKGEVSKVVEQELGEGRVDVRQLVIGVMDKVVGRELDGVLLPKPLLSAAALEWPTKQGEIAAEQVETAAMQQAKAEDAKVDEAPKAPSDLIASVIAGIKQKQQAEAAGRSSGADGPVAMVLASIKRKQQADGPVAKVLASIKQKQQAVEGSGWSGGGGCMIRYILEGMTL